MTDEEIDSLSGYSLAVAVAEAMEQPPTNWSRYGMRSPGGWWVAATGAWLPVVRSPGGDAMLLILDRLAEIGCHANIEDFGPQAEARRFFVAGGSGAGMIVAYAPDLPTAVMRLLLRVVARREFSEMT